MKKEKLLNLKEQAIQAKGEEENQKTLDALISLIDRALERDIEEIEPFEVASLYFLIGQMGAQAGLLDLEALKKLAD